MFLRSVWLILRLSPHKSGMSIGDVRPALDAVGASQMLQIHSSVGLQFRGHLVSAS